MPDPIFEKSVFINCPFDPDYAPILQAILFCVIYLDFSPRLATESNNSGDIRLEKIRGMIEASLFSIHDLSRCEAKKKGERYRLNMPFELGIDYGCQQYFGKDVKKRRSLFLKSGHIVIKQRFQILLVAILKPTVLTSRKQCVRCAIG